MALSNCKFAKQFLSLLKENEIGQQRQLCELSGPGSRSALLRDIKLELLQSRKLTHWHARALRML